MFDTDPAVLDADATLTDVVAAREAAEAAEVRILSDAAHWADLHDHLDDTGGVSLPAMEQLVCFGGDGTPVVAEFAPAELGAVLAMSTNSAAMLVGDALDLRHRLPRLWARIQIGEVRAWVGRRTAQATRSLSQQTVAVVDHKVSKWAHSVSWGRLQAIIDAAVIEADPAGCRRGGRAGAEVAGCVGEAPSPNRTERLRILEPSVAGGRRKVWLSRPSSDGAKRPAELMAQRHERNCRTHRNPQRKPREPDSPPSLRMSPPTMVGHQDRPPWTSSV